MNLLIFTDGAARGNPGPAGCGAVLAKEKGEIIETHTKYLGVATNNVAEYEALIIGLTEAKKHKDDIESIRCYADSKLIVEQAKGNYKVKNATLAELHAKVRELVMELPPVEFFYIPREKNKQADLLANKAIDEHV